MAVITTRIKSGMLYVYWNGNIVLNTNVSHFEVPVVQISGNSVNIIDEGRMYKGYYWEFNDEGYQTNFGTLTL